MRLRVLFSRSYNKVLEQLFRVVDSLLNTNFYWEHIFRKNGYHTNDFEFSKNQMAFVHLPKTGGTSFYKMLEEKRFEGIVNTRVHRPISIFCSPKEYKYLTIFRNPVDRVWSLYQMVLRTPPNSPYRKHASRGLSCFLENCWEARDMYCRYLSGDVYATPQTGNL